MMRGLYQADIRWSKLPCGHGPGTIGRVGCVLTSLTNAARAAGTRPDLLPPHANQACLNADVFQHWDETQKKMVRGDELLLGKAAPLFGLVAPDAETVAGEPGDAQIREAVKRALGADNEGNQPGFAFLRIDHGHGRHTILAIERDVHVGVVRCLDPAIGSVDLGFASLEGLAVWGKGDVRRYRVVGVRPVRRAAQ